MKTLLAVVTVAVMVTLAAPAGARPIHEPGPPSRPPSSGGPYAPRMDLWIVIVTAGASFGLGAAATRIAAQRRGVPA
jgi:hypothetical protein